MIRRNTILSAAFSSALLLNVEAAVPRQIFRSFKEAPKQTREFAEMGITTRCFLVENLHLFGYKPVWTGGEEFHFENYDKQVEDIFKESPNAQLICIVDINTPFGLRNSYIIDSNNDISIALSDKRMVEDISRYLREFLKYSEQKYGDRIVSYMLSAGGGLSEWFEPDVGQASREKNRRWREWQEKHGLKYDGAAPTEWALSHAALENLLYDPITEADKIDYWRFHNEIIADGVLEFSKITKEMIGKKELGMFFGYSVKRGQVLSSWGHGDTLRVFESPYIDWFAAPGTYSDRKVGGGTGSQLVPLAVWLRGKRFLHEIDHRTHLSPRYKLFGITERERDDPQANKEDLAGLKREFAYSLVNHASYWWFDMDGGWYDDPEVRNFIKRTVPLYERYGADESKPTAEILLVLDLKSFPLVNGQEPKCAAFADSLRTLLNHAGQAPHEICYFDDLEKMDLSQFKLIFMPTQFVITPERERFLREKVLKDGRYVAWTYAPGVTDGKCALDTNRVKKFAGVDFKTNGISITDMGGWKSVYVYLNEVYTPENLHDLERQAGVHFYLDGIGDPVFANERFLSVHTLKGGERTIRLPRKVQSVTDILTGEQVAAETDVFTVNFESPDTKIFEVK